VLATP